MVSPSAWAAAVITRPHLGHVMRTSLKVSVVPFVVLLACALVLGAQSSKQDAAKASNGPASPHDLSGVWTMHAPPSARSYIVDTFTKDEPALTPWGEEQYKATKPSNGPRTHTLDTTDDPVLRSCLPPGYAAYLPAALPSADRSNAQ